MMFAYGLVKVDDDDWEYVMIALDPLTLEVQHRFGRRFPHDVTGIMASDSEVFVSEWVGDQTGEDDDDEDTIEYACLHVFSHAGEYLRELRLSLDASLPHYPLCINDRIYLMAFGLDRIYVLSLEGEVLQVYRIGRSCNCYCAWAGGLLVGGPSVGPSEPQLKLLRGV